MKIALFRYRMDRKLIQCFEADGKALLLMGRNHTCDKQVDRGGSWRSLRIPNVVAPCR